MIKSEQEEFLKLVKQGTIETLKSAEAKSILKATMLEALKSKEADEILFDSFMSAFKEVVLPGLDTLQKDVDQLKDDTLDIKEDVSYLKSKAVKSDKFTEMVKERLFRRQ